MKSNQPAVRQFGQLSLPSSLLFKSSSKDSKEDTQSKPSKSSISLSDFLNRKLNKTNHKSIQRVEGPFSSICSIHVGSVHEDTSIKRDEGDTDLVPNGAIFQQFKNPVKEEECGSLRDGCEVRELQSESAIDGLDSRKRKSPFAVSTGGDGRPITPSYLVVLGDDPKPKRREQWCMNKRPKPLFNHYANGGGWWDCNREGFDSEEVGCSDVWEGMGSTTLGGLEWH